MNSDVVKNEGEARLTLAHYTKAYDFRFIEPRSSPDLSELESRYRAEPYGKRRRVFKKQWKKALAISNRLAEIAEKFCPDEVDLGLYWIGGEWPLLLVSPRSDLYLGGIKRPIEYSRPGTGRAFSLYTGELPTAVVEVYERAVHYWSHKEVVVVSRDPSLFDTRIVAPAVSPLLVAVDRKLGRLFLLAAWGLEHELPKSLGGLLDD